ncbi:hypothetical protein M1146_03215 [Patescibacteria group bacterium]|nr:hypothetical protein [Patescibacteria group bacterium]
MEINSGGFFKRGKLTEHYYGDIIRALFLIGAVVMLIMLPFSASMLPFPASFSILIILVLGFLAGFTNPAQEWINFLNVIASGAGAIAFEYAAATVNFSSAHPLVFIFFVINQTLAVVFFLALYYSIKTLRGIWLDKSKKE